MTCEGQMDDVFLTSASRYYGAMHVRINIGTYRLVEHNVNPMRITKPLQSVHDSRQMIFLVFLSTEKFKVESF